MADNKNKPWLFQKGQSGNPKGRPRKGKSFCDILNAELKKQKQQMTNHTTGEVRTIDGKTALCLAYIKLAFNAEQESVRASCAEKIMKFIDGDFVQHVDMAANVSGINVIQNVKDSLDKLSPEERDVFLDLSEKLAEENESE